MNNLPVKLDVVNDEPLVSTLIVAENVIDIENPTEQQISKKNRTIRDMIKKNLLDFEEFGGVRFENATLETKGGKQEISYINLNEQQATLLITYLRNNDKVRVFKKNLVKAFFMMKQKLENGIYKKELLKIHTLTIGNKDTKTVDARELHTALKSTHVYESWIRKQTIKASLTKDIHYCEVNNEDTKTTYISVDSAKHIAMMSQSKTAHEVRDYLREVENTVPVHSGGVSEIVPIITNFMEYQTKQTDMIISQNNTMIEIIKELKDTKQSKPKTITKEQMKKIRANTYIIAGYILEYESWQNESDIMARLYRGLNARMGVSSYYDIAYEDFDEAIELQLRTIEKWQEKVKNKDRKESTEDYSDIEF
jgi:phage anti-repressor protein